MSKENPILNKIVEVNEGEEIITADGFDMAVIGIDDNTNRVIYSISKCVQILIDVDGMSEEDAIDYLYFNSIGSYIGDKTPIWCNDL